MCTTGLSVMTLGNPRTPTWSVLPMSLQGPHHCAWKSTSTGCSLARTMSSKLAYCCVVFTASMVNVAARPTVLLPLPDCRQLPCQAL